MANASATETTPEPPPELTGGEAALALAWLLLLLAALPVLSVVGSMPSGLISAFIIFIGLRQAWSMTGAPVLQVLGPYQVGTDSLPSSLT